MVSAEGFSVFLSCNVSRVKGCVYCSVYQDLDEEHAYCIVAEWETHEAMQKHFLTQKFEVLIGAARVLGETFEMIMNLPARIFLIFIIL